MNKLNFFRNTLILISILNLVACDSGPTLEQKISMAQTMVPSDAKIAEIYQRTCRNCHILEATGAPLTGDTQSWQALIQQSGKPGLVDHVINGKGGMPPFGLCMECGMDDFSKLIDFMANQDNQ